MVSDLERSMNMRTLIENIEEKGLKDKWSAITHFIIKFLFLYITRRLVTGRIYVKAMDDSVVHNTNV